MALPIFPVHLFNPSAMQMKPMGRAIASPPSLSGVSQSVRTDGGGFWQGSMSGISLRDSRLINGWRAWEDYLQGGARECLVPVIDPRNQPRPLMAGKPARAGSVATSMGADEFFPETLAYSSPMITATAHAAKFRATTMTFNFAKGVPGRGYFGINHPNKGWRTYRIGRILSRSGTSITAEISHPLREAFAGGAIEFDFPLMRAIVAPDADTSPDIENGRYAKVGIVFREAL